MKRLELSGRVFGELRVVGLSEVSRGGHARWSCVCSCGVEKTVFGTHLVSGKVTHCGHVARKARNWGGVGALPLTYYSQIKRGASGEGGRRTALEFSVSMAYLAKLYDEQGGVCRYSALPIDFRSRTASLDRIDSSNGYVEGNVQWLHKDINMMKRHYSEEYFLHLVKSIASCEVT